MAVSSPAPMRFITRMVWNARDGSCGHEAELARQREINDKLLSNEGTENPSGCGASWARP